MLPITVKNKLEFKEYLGLMNRLTFKNVSIQFIVCVVICFCLPFLVARENPDSMNFMITAVGIVFIGIFLRTKVYLNAKKNYALPQTSECITFIFNEDTLEVQSSFTIGTIKWGAFVKALELEDWILIYPNSVTANIIHKKNFDSKEDLDTVINLLKSKPIKEKIFLKK